MSHIMNKQRSSFSHTTLPSNLLSFLSSLELGVVHEINRLRTSPATFINELQQRKQFYSSTHVYHPPTNKIGIQTNEGVAALDDAIQFLKQTQPMPPLTPSKGLCAACTDHVRDLSSGGMSHTGSDGSSSSSRMRRYGVWSGVCGENLDLGNDNAADIVMALLIDDGVAGRGHRLNLLNPRFQYVGVAVGPHAVYKHCCCMDFASNFEESTEKGSSSTSTPSSSSISMPNIGSTRLSVSSMNPFGTRPKSPTLNAVNVKPSHHSPSSSTSSVLLSTSPSPSSSSSSSSSSSLSTHEVTVSSVSDAESALKTMPASMRSSMLQTIQQKLTDGEKHHLTLKVSVSADGQGRRGSMTLVDRCGNRTSTQTANWSSSESS